MDKFTENILQEWEFAELIERFKEEEIDETAFLALTENMIAKLIPKIGRQSKFYELFIKLKKKLIQEKETCSQLSSGLVVDEEVSLISSDLIDISKLDMILIDNNLKAINELTNVNIMTDKCNDNISSVEEITTKNIYSGENYISDILYKTNDGLMVLEYYKLHKILSFSMRNMLSSVIIKHEFFQQGHHQITKSKFISLTKGIITLFPSEHGNTYFTPYFKQGQIVSPNRGKLYDKYCNLKRNITKITDSNKRKHVDLCHIQQELLVEDEYEDSLNWLKNNVEPEVLLHKFWKETAKFRLTSQIQFHVMDIYPALKKPTGHFLIELDFGYLFPGTELYLFKKFDYFKEKFKILIKKTPLKLSSNDSYFLTVLNNPNKYGDDDLAALMLLPYLFQPTNVVLKNKKTYRPSKIEQSKSFITHIVNANELKTLHTKNIESAQNLGLTVQPYVVIVGNINSSEPLRSYTVIDDTYYLLETPIKAIDVCYKSFHSLNLLYPVKANQVWCFIEQFFFNVDHTIKGKQFLSIKTIINDLEIC